MFNLKQAKKNKNITPADKALEKNRESNDAKSSENPQVYNGMLKEDQRESPVVPTEAQFEREESSGPPKIMEKQFEREKMGTLYVPAINAYVEKMVQERRKEYTNLQEKKSNWTTEKPTQNGDLPAWPKSPAQHNKMTLPGKVDRKPNEEALIGGKILKASVDDAVYAVKTGQTKSYDHQIVEILRRAHDEARDLSSDEKNEINRLKIARTAAYLKEGRVHGQPPFGLSEVFDDPYSRENSDAGVPKPKDRTQKSLGLGGTSTHNSQEVSSDGGDDDQINSFTSGHDTDTYFYDGMIMDEDDGGKVRPRTSFTGEGPATKDSPTTNGLEDDPGGNFATAYPDDQSPSEVATHNFLRFQKRPNKKVNFNGFDINQP